MSDDEFETNDAVAFWFSGVGGSSFSGFSETWSPSCGGLLPDLMAAWVLGLSSVPRTVLECGFDMTMWPIGDLRVTRFELSKTCGK